MKKVIPAPGLPKGALQDVSGEFVFPTTEGEAADLLYQTREARLKIQKTVDRHQALETFLSNHFIENLPAKKASGIAGAVARVQVETNPVPQVKDWPRFFAYAAKKKAWELLQHRFSKEAVNERVDGGEAKAMGVTIFNAKRVSCTKL